MRSKIPTFVPSRAFPHGSGVKICDVDGYFTEKRNFPVKKRSKSATPRYRRAVRQARAREWRERGAREPREDVGVAASLAWFRPGSGWGQSVARIRAGTKPRVGRRRASLAVGNNAVPVPGAGGPLSGGAFDFALDRAAAQRALAASASAGGGAAPSSKVRKPYTITKQRERWTEEEHEGFLEALKLHGRAWKKIEEHIGTKSAVQIRSHAQKFFSKLQREAQKSGTVDRAGNGDGPSESESTVTVIPPARPKRKPAHPYPRKAPDPGVHPTHSGGIANGAGASMNALKGTFGGVANGGDPNVAAAAAAAFMMAMGNGNAGFGAADPAARRRRRRVADRRVRIPILARRTGKPRKRTRRRTRRRGWEPLRQRASLADARARAGQSSRSRVARGANAAPNAAPNAAATAPNAAAAAAGGRGAGERGEGAAAVHGGARDDRGGGGGGGAQQQPPRAPAAAPPPSTAAAQQTPRPAPDIFSAMLNAVAAGNTAAGAPNAAAPSLSDTAAFANWAAAMGAATNGSAQLATNGSAEGEAGPNVGAKGNVDQMAALANVMMFFPGIPGGAGAGGGAGAAVAEWLGGRAADALRHRHRHQPDRVGERPGRRHHEGEPRRAQECAREAEARREREGRRLPRLKGWRRGWRRRSWRKGAEGEARRFGRPGDHRESQRRRRGTAQNLRQRGLGFRRGFRRGFRLERADGAGCRAARV